MMLQAGPHWP